MLSESEYSEYQMRYRKGEWRTLIFRDIILAETRELGRLSTFLDIGCGTGFDGSAEIQKTLSEAADGYIGVDPDGYEDKPNYFSEFHCCQFEEARIEQNSVDLAFSVMVLEHVRDPVQFWLKVAKVLKPGGVFWGFTMDRRHFFCHVSQLMDRLRIKNLFFRFLQGKRGHGHYLNYKTYYRLNSPRQIKRDAKEFANSTFVNFSRVGQLNYYIPRPLRPFSNCLDWTMSVLGMPGSLLAVRLEKKVLCEQARTDISEM